MPESESDLDLLTHEVVEVVAVRAEAEAVRAVVVVTPVPAETAAPARAVGGAEAEARALRLRRLLPVRLLVATAASVLPPLVLPEERLDLRALRELLSPA